MGISINKLTELSIRSLTVGKHFDGGGLYLLVKGTQPSSRLWRMKYRYGGKEKLLAIGKYPEISVKEARLARDEAKRNLRDGIDPSQSKVTAKKILADEISNSVKACTYRWIEKMSSGWGDKTRHTTESLFLRDVFPYIGGKPITQVGDPTTDFTPIMKMAVANFAIVVNPQIGAQDLAGVIALAKAKPGQINFGSPGNGTPHHLAMELMKQQLGFDMLHVPYKGISNATTDLIGGQVQLMFASVHSMLPHVKSGRLRMLAATGAARSPITPTVPVFKELGIDFMDAVDSWYALLAPAKTSGELVKSLHRDVSAVLAMPDVREQLVGQGLAIQISSPEQLGELVKTDYARWRKTVADAKIPIE